MYRFGPVRNNVMNMEVALPDGTIIETGYDNISAYMSGYNFNQLFVGAQNTLGRVCTVTFRVYPLSSLLPMVFNFSDLRDAAPFVNAIASHPSIKPLFVGWADANHNREKGYTGCNATVLVVLHGSDRVVDAEEKEIMEMSHGAVRLEPSLATDMWIDATVSRDRGAVVPVRNFAAFLEECSAAEDAEGGCTSGMLVDGQTAFFECCCHKDSCRFAVNAAKFGGRRVSFDNFFDESVSGAEAVAYMKELRNIIVHHGQMPGSERLSREVTPEVIEELKAAVGEDNVNIDPVERLSYSHDLAPLPAAAGVAFKNIPEAVVRPASAKAVAAVMEIAFKHGIAVTPRGNSTWGLGGSQPIAGGIVIDFASKLNKIMKFDAEAGYVKVGAGITFKEVLDFAESKGFIIGCHPSSYPAATIGGWYGTNGMGVGTYRFGSIKDNILNAEMVLPDGRIIETGFDSISDLMSGYNLNQWFAGAEGTLGLMATATIRLIPRGIIRPTIYNFENLADAHVIIRSIASHPSIKPLHISWADHNHFENQRRARAAEHSIHVHDECKNTMLLVLQGSEAVVDAEDAELKVMAAASGGERLSDEIAEHEWEERCYEFRARAVGVGEIPAEVIVPSEYWGVFVDECYKAFGTMKMEAGGIIGNAVDANTVLFMPYYFMDNESMLGMTAFSFNFHVGDLAVKYGGRTTGLGVFFAWNLDNIHDVNTVALMRQIKTALDPHDVMNPGHLVCGRTRFGMNLSHGLMEFASMLMQAVKAALPADSAFSDNIKRFRYNTLEEDKMEDRRHVLGRGYE